MYQAAYVEKQIFNQGLLEVFGKYFKPYGSGLLVSEIYGR